MWFPIVVGVDIEVLLEPLTVDVVSNPRALLVGFAVEVGSGAAEGTGNGVANAAAVDVVGHIE